MNKPIHLRVGKELDSWSKIYYSDWFYMLNEGFEPDDNQEITTYLLSTLYDKEFQKTVLSQMTKEDYILWRDNLIKKTRLHANFPEVIYHLSEWNMKFDIK